MSYLLALDQGTTSSRTTLFTATGETVATASRPFAQHYPEPGWVEHDPEEIWESQLATLKEVLASAPVPLSSIASLGITNQRETTIVWERESGRALHRAIVWQDRRCAPLTDRLAAQGLEPEIARRTGLLLDPYFSAGKLAWLFDNVPGLRERGERGEICFGTVDSWLIYRLSGGRLHLTDLSNASRTLLFNIHTLEWDEELLRIFGLPAAILPRVLPSASFFGHCDPAVTGMSVPITGVAGDQQAALFGQGCLKPGMAKATFGTGAFVMMNSGREGGKGEGVLTTVAWQLPGEPVTYALEGSIFIAGAAVQWLKEGLGIIGSAAEVEELARSVPDAGGVFFVPALSGLGTPYWDPHARGVIAGLTRGSSRAHLARAALEAIAYQTADATAAMAAGCGVSLSELRVDGGAAANDLLLEFMAGVVGAPVLRPACTESTSLGAAFLGGIGAGVLDAEAAAACWRLEKRFEPGIGEERRRELLERWRRSVRLSLGWDAPG
ncbi:glycerol kinase GlpK [Geomonas sp. Red32]|uniref:glycerol kinase GlpK n=1 Tax=Geomonas sp. Red32 TaxID=2912856 RepID=UPI00202CB792|nr:glycerol kinase GlpK [Geomonas sp. Red32]